MNLKSHMQIVLVLVLTLFSTSVIAGDINLQARPFWGSFEGEASFPFSDACLDVTGAPFQTRSYASGKMAHLGNSTLSTTHCATPDGGAALNGYAIFKAANGDEVWASYFAITVQQPPIIEQEITLVIDGGTGRFENASGSLQGKIYIEFQGFADPSWPLEFVLSGWIVY